MTREEALEWFKDRKEMYLLDDKCQQAEDIAIKALEQVAILDQIRAEIKEKFEGCDICEWFEDYDYEGNPISEYSSVGTIDEVLQIIDKYKKGR